MSPNELTSASVQLSTEEPKSLQSPAQVVENLDAKPGEQVELRLAKVHGAFYRQLVELLLSEIPLDEKKQQAQGLMAELPPHLRSLYQQGEQELTAILEYQRDWIQDHRQTAVKELVQMVLPSFKADEQQKQVVIEQTAATGELQEPIPGLPIMVIPAETYDEWKELGGVFRAGDAVAFLGSKQEEISFLLLRKGREIHVISNQQANHEAHHVIWHFLSRAGFLRAPATGEPASDKAFAHFRDEMGAYILQQKTKLDLNYVDPEILVYTDDESLIMQGYQTREKVEAIGQLITASGLSIDTLLFAIAKARNFDELVENATQLVELAGAKTEQLLPALFEVWHGDTRFDLETRTSNRRHWMDDILQRVIKNGEHQVTPELSEQVFAQLFLAENQLRIERVIKEAELFSAFSREQLGLEVDMQQVLRKWAENHIPFDQASKSYLAELGMGNGERIYIPFDMKTSAEFGQWLMNTLLWRAEDQLFVRKFEAMMDNCPDLRALIEEQGQALIESGFPQVASEMGERAVDRKNKALAILERVVVKK